MFLVKRDMRFKENLSIRSPMSCIPHQFSATSAISAISASADRINNADIGIRLGRTQFFCFFLGKMLSYHSRTRDVAADIFFTTLLLASLQP